MAYQAEAEVYQDWNLPPLTQTTEALQQEFLALSVLKAMHSGKIVGSVRAQLINNVCHIGRLIVHPDFQKKGIGTALLHDIESLFKHAKSYELFTGNKSEGNIKLYRNRGYQVSHTKYLSERVTLTYLHKQQSL